VGDFETVGSNGGIEFKFEIDDHESLIFLELCYDFSIPVVPFVGVSLNEDDPFVFDSLGFSSNIDFKLNFEIVDDN